MMGKKRLWLTGALVALIAVAFWSQSRVPALNEKAEMGGELQLEDPLAFDVLLPVERIDPLPVKVAYTTVNWAYTNWKGMTFGILIGSALMGLFGLLARRSYKNPIINSALGIVIGAPLGVCVNCATPIAQGIYSAGARLETALAMLLSSPTMNVIVLTMLIAMFPPYFVVIKLGLTVGFLIIGIPLVARRFAGEAKLTIDDEVCPIDLNAKQDPNETWVAAGIGVGRDYVKNFGWIVKKTLPLMVLAGFLGSLAIHVLPWDVVVNLFEDHGGRVRHMLGDYGVAVLGLTIVASLGIVLPVPMTFDLIIVATLLGAGMPVHYAMALLFTLGIFSVYPFTVIWQEISRPVALALAVVLTGLGVAGGLAAFGYDRWDRANRGELFARAFGAEAPPERERPAVVAVEAKDVRTALVGHTPEALPFVIDGGLHVDRFPFAPSEPQEGPLFVKSDGQDYGIDEPYSFELRRFVRPWSYHRPIAAGDVHNDGWPDLVLPVYDGGVALYANVGGRFVRQKVDLPSLEGVFVGQLALADLDDDGWLDLFVATYRHGNFVIHSDAGEFTEANLERLPALDIENSLSASASFGDLDHDGDLDIALGNWARWQKREEARNSLLMREGDGYELRPLSDPILGETLSILMTDWNVDGRLDLIVGNEGQPSFFYEGDGAGGLTVVERDRGLFPAVPKTVMNIAVADIDNDLVPEVYLGQITGRSTGTDHVPAISPEELCGQLEDESIRERCKLDTVDYQLMRRSWRARDTRMCLAIKDAHSRDTCLAYHVLGAADWSKDPKVCEHLPDRWSDVRNQCRSLFNETVAYGDDDYARALPQVRNKNVFFKQSNEKRFEDRAAEFGIAVAGWTWNGKFADLDNDEWQDLVIANGMLEGKTRETTLLFLNRGGKGFEDATQSGGVEDYFPVSGYTYVDIDRDGDLDVVAAPVQGPVWVYENRGAKGRAIDFELRDFQGNRFGVGSKIIVHYGEGESSHQVREIQAGGGFISFDPFVAHFGLGEHESVTRVEVEWSSGGRTELRGDFRAGACYRITRPPGSHADLEATSPPPA